jgi:hypothetical protein
MSTPRRPPGPRTLAGALALAATLAAAPLAAQSLNIDFGEPGAGPPPEYAAAGLPGVWNSFRGDHGVTVANLVGLDGAPTAASLRQIGGFETPVVDDPQTTGSDSLLMDDYLVTFSASLESCIYLDHVQPGTYEVLIYARMPMQPLVGAYTSVDQEPGFPHYIVGGPWPGEHQELITYSRHFAVVGPDGNLDLHSGVVPGANPALGAALNGLQIRLLDMLFADGFEAPAAPAPWP